MSNATEPFVDPNRLTNGEAASFQVHSSTVLPSSLQARVDALAQSVGAPHQNNLSSGYDPDLFLEALKSRHDALAMITDRLEKRHNEQEERQRELDVREKQVAFREKRIAAHERLSDKSKMEALVTINKNERTVVPAQPGYFIVELLSGDTEADCALHLLPIIAWVTETTVTVYKKEEMPHVTTSYPVTIECSTVDDEYIIKCPDGRYFSPELQWWEANESQEVLRHLISKSSMKKE